MYEQLLINSCVIRDQKVDLLIMSCNKLVKFESKMISRFPKYENFRLFAVQSQKLFGIICRPGPGTA